MSGKSQLREPEEMQKCERIVSYTAEEIDEMLARGESMTNWKRVHALTEEELEASIDHEDEGEFDWSTLYVGLPMLELQLTNRLDPEEERRAH